MSTRIRGKTIVLTGASSGIGEAAALKLGARGARLCLVARRRDELLRVRTAVINAGGECWIYPADLARDDEVQACAEAILAEHPQVDVLINNAGRSIRRRVSESFDRFHDYQRTMQINYFAAVRLTLLLLPQMLARGEGQIISISSFSTLLPVPRFSAYVASKCALEGFSRSLSAELVGKHIQISLIHFPLVKTAMTAPTQVYQHTRQMEVATAADWIVDAIRQRPTRVAPNGAQFINAAFAALPGPTTAVFGRLIALQARRLQRRVDAEPSG